MPGDPETIYKGSIQLYINEVILGSNTVLFERNNVKESFVTYTVLNYMSTKGLHFCKKAFGSFDNLLSRSTLVSVSEEKKEINYFSG